MDPLFYSPVLALALVLLLASGLWVAVSLIGVALLGMLLFADAPIELVMPSSIWGAVSSWTLTALPLFVWMGEILFRTKLADDLFNGLAPWTNRLPGRLMHVNVIGCGIFAAVSGSSAATAATVGQMSLPELKRRGYDEGTSIGSLAASGTLGLLIPPSIIMIVYGVSANVSIARLFLAGVLPGLLMMALFMGYIMIWSLLNRDRMPPAEPSLPMRERIKRLRLLLPTVLLIIAVIGSIYGGVATATEAATLGVVGSLLVALFSGSLTWENFKESLYGATRTSCMIGFIIAAAAFLSVVMGYAGIPRALATWIGTLELSPYGLIFSLTILFLILGCFLDGISMVVLTTAVIMPMVEAAHIDLIWFGIFIVLVVEIAQITPPVGFNLFVVQGLTGYDILRVARAVLPFFLVLCLGILLITIFPEIATWLPRTMFSAT
ncbi:TRAP transporter large permease [Enterovirga sp. CN4-39]|uniref:TRAP transporter large permease n=1 Tax=Enterovirga sp. CN4-39 TaxID=3400910 RepID=UPI003C0A7523